MEREQMKRDCTANMQSGQMETNSENNVTILSACKEGKLKTKWKYKKFGVTV